MKKLVDIIKGVNPIEIIGNSDIYISGLGLNSSKINPGDLFFAIKGTETDGHLYIQNAIDNGAAAIIVEKINDQTYKESTMIVVKDSTIAMSIIASNYFGNPSEKLNLVGITGTNGKTTIATLLYRLFLNLGHKTGLISTVCNCINENEIATSHTTPDVITFNSLLSEMVDEGCEYCFAEVSSHSIVQQRIGGLNFVGGVFTNLTHDHLDFHNTFSEYLKAKKTFFDNLPSTSFALINSDDKNGNVMLQNTKAKKYSYALHSMSDFHAKVLELHLNGMLLSFNNIELWTILTGKFNAYNLLAIYSTAVLLGKDSEKILQILSSLKAVKGRFETVSCDGITAIIDYAHTPDAIVNVIETINEIRNGNGLLITVVGAGGNRDKTKRPKMAKAAAQLSDKVILTSDNPRNEIPEIIIEEMYAGLDYILGRKVLKILDRKEAIKTACAIAKKGDIILIAGKGHENYQEINGIKTHFDDKEIVEECLNQYKN